MSQNMLFRSIIVTVFIINLASSNHEIETDYKIHEHYELPIGWSILHTVTW